MADRVADVNRLFLPAVPPPFGYQQTYCKRIHVCERVSESFRVLGSERGEAMWRRERAAVGVAAEQCRADLGDTASGAAEDPARCAACNAKLTATNDRLRLAHLATLARDDREA